ncbi:TetR family transcriptional regulator [Fulvitalea axinellae]|uniref:TetR family transcriptional regulator n=1 Tax=Fulvitalea axinellae TaxID=1182444 RepID=A0AAU9CW28_9BACT|nr:TetR family transcriptional regulator [Fulvitalea axinellae]
MGKKLEKKEAIVEAALRLFCTEGFQGTSTAKISKEAGVATGTLFLYFKSKDELINKLYIEAKRRMFEAITKGLDSNWPVCEQFEHLWTNLAMWAEKDFWAFKFANQYKYSPYIDKLSQEEVAESFAFAQNLIAKAEEEDLFGPLPTEFYMKLFFTVLVESVGYIVSEKLKGEEKERFVKNAFEAAWKSISK